jgi:hypothetical protein
LLASIPDLPPSEKVPALLNLGANKVASGARGAEVLPLFLLLLINQ